MPDLGKYAANVLSAYGIGLVLLLGLVVLSLWQSRRIKRDLTAAENRRKQNGA